MDYVTLTGWTFSLSANLSSRLSGICPSSW